MYSALRSETSWLAALRADFLVSEHVLEAISPLMKQVNGRTRESDCGAHLACLAAQSQLIPPWTHGTQRLHLRTQDRRLTSLATENHTGALGEATCTHLLDHLRPDLEHPILRHDKHAGQVGADPAAMDGVGGLLPRADHAELQASVSRQTDLMLDNNNN